MNKKNIKRGLMPYLFITIVMLGLLYFVNFANTKVNLITYDEFMTEVSKENVKEVVLTPRSRAGVYEVTGTLKGYSDGETFFFRVPLAEESISKLVEASENSKFTIDTTTDPESSTILLFLVNVLPLVILVGVAFFFISRQMGTANKSMDFGKSRARLNEDSKKVTFKQVAGLDEEKKRLQN